MSVRIVQTYLRGPCMNYNSKLETYANVHFNDRQTLRCG